MRISGLRAQLMLLKSILSSSAYIQYPVPHYPRLQQWIIMIFEHGVCERFQHALLVTSKKDCLSTASPHAIECCSMPLKTTIGQVFPRHIVEKLLMLWHMYMLSLKSFGYSYHFILFKIFLFAVVQDVKTHKPEPVTGREDERLGCLWLGVVGGCQIPLGNNL